MPNTFVKAADYAAWLTEVKSRIQSARISAARAVNRDLILLYWDIGRGIVEKQNAHGWGQAVIDRLSHDLSTAFPAVTGFSSRNLRNMKQFDTAYSQPEFLQRVVAELSRQSSVPFADEKWQQAVAKLSRLGVMEFLGQAVPELRGKFPTSRSVIPAKAGIQALGRWMPDRVRHDESGSVWLQPNVKRSGRLAAPAL